MMDRKTTKFDWNRARAFLATAEEGSLSAAARALGMAQPTLSRQVAALEAEIGVVLFERVGQGLSLTPSGMELLDHVRAMGEAANGFALGSFGRSQGMTGQVSISASEICAAYMMPPILRKLRQQEPGIEIVLNATVRISDLRRREADIAIRNVRPVEPDLIAKKVTEVAVRFYATPEYIKKMGHPASLKDLRGAEFINHEDSEMYAEFLAALGGDRDEISFPIIAENNMITWELVKSGLGISLWDSKYGDAEPLVERVFPDAEPLMFPLWLVAHRELKSNPRIRFVFDLLAAELSK
ncbi:MAG: LysR family transcriptional regulator [Paracoccaceae bacterium]